MTKQERYAERQRRAALKQIKGKNGKAHKKREKALRRKNAVKKPNRPVELKKIVLHGRNAALAEQARGILQERRRREIEGYIQDEIDVAKGLKPDERFKLNTGAGLPEFDLGGKL